MNFKEFAYSRYSLRNFSPGKIANSLIKEAVEIAQKCKFMKGRVKEMFWHIRMEMQGLGMMLIKY